MHKANLENFCAQLVLPIASKVEMIMSISHSLLNPTQNLDEECVDQLIQQRQEHSVHNA